MMEIQTISALNYKNTSICATIYSSSDNQGTNSTTILYLHGGGLVFGQRDDLPKSYIEKFIKNNRVFISIDYLLSPEVKLDEMLKVLKQSISSISRQYQISNNLFLMGRSAGAYLCYLLIRDGIKAKGFISLYGYHQITLPEFTNPAPFYTRFPRVLPMNAQLLVKQYPLVKGPMQDRYPIYLSGRQFGTWINSLVPLTKSKKEFSLTNEDLRHFPPTILLHSTNDPDVPFSMSLTASQIIPNALLIPIEKQEHDFDRKVTNENLSYYDRIVNFTNTVK